MYRFLVSFHYHRTTDIGRIAATYGGPCEVFADSGAYSASTLGATISLADYAAWLTDGRDTFTTMATLDVIGDYRATMRNTRKLEDKGLPVLPVFHTGTPWPELVKLCKQYRYVALGGMVPFGMRKAELMRWMIHAFKIGREHGTVFHGFGQTTYTALAALPFYSVDSSSWGAGARYGSMFLWDHRRNRVVTVKTGNPAAARAADSLLRSHGADPATVGRPGFAVKTRRTPEQYRAEDRMCRGTPAVAFDRMGRWLTTRHHVAPPPGWTSTGTALFLADSNDGHLMKAAAAIAADHAKETSR